MTKLGPLDVLGTIGRGQDYEGLVNRTIEQEVGGLHFRLLDLENLINIKKETITEKDKVMILILQRTLEEKGKKAGG